MNDRSQREVDSPRDEAPADVRLVAPGDGLWHLIVSGRDVATYADKGAALAGVEVEKRRLAARRRP